MILSFWRNRRIAKIENDLYLQSYPTRPQNQAQIEGVLGKSFTVDSLGQDNFCRLARYESSIDRAFYRAAQALQFRTQRQANPTPFRRVE